jgi:hypothetical protein
MALNAVSLGSNIGPQDTMAAPPVDGLEPVAVEDCGRYASCAEFLSKWGREPVLLKGAAQHWLAFKQFTPEFLLRSLQGIALEVRAFESGEWLRRTMHVDDFAARVQAGRGTYLADFFLFEKRPQLLQAVLPYLPACLTEDYLSVFPGTGMIAHNPWMNLYWGTAGSATVPHYDNFAGCTWNAVMSGGKRWFLFDGRSLPFFRYQRALLDVGLLDPLTLMITPQTLDRHLASKERLRLTGAIRWADVGAGDVLHVPSLWVHQVHNVSETIAVSRLSVNRTNLDGFFRFVRTTSGICAEALARVVLGGQARRVFWKKSIPRAALRMLDGAIYAARRGQDQV